MSKTERAVLYRSKGYSKERIAEVLGTSVPSVQAMLWAHDNPGKRRYLTRDSQRRVNAGTSGGRGMMDERSINAWWAARS